MPNHCDRLRCPLCEGHGEVRRSQLMEFFSDPELKSKLDNYLAAVMPLEQAPEPVAAAVREQHNFQKEVHSWNPKVPMWQRSPKE